MLCFIVWWKYKGNGLFGLRRSTYTFQYTVPNRILKIEKVVFDWGSQWGCVSLYENLRRVNIHKDWHNLYRFPPPDKIIFVSKVHLQAANKPRFFRIPFTPTNKNNDNDNDQDKPTNESNNKPRRRFWTFGVNSVSCWYKSV